jgi:hypothetical protein
MEKAKTELKRSNIAIFSLNYFIQGRRLFRMEKFCFFCGYRTRIPIVS